MQRIMMSGRGARRIERGEYTGFTLVSSQLCMGRFSVSIWYLQFVKFDVLALFPVLVVSDLLLNPQSRQPRHWQHQQKKVVLIMQGIFQAVCLTLIIFQKNFSKFE